MAYHSVRKKMAEALLRLQRRDGLEFKIAREDLAAMAAMATETVSRTLSDFKEEGLIEKKGSAIIITDLARLSKMKN
jgi:CRP-like cAMP-binding protein